MSQLFTGTTILAPLTRQQKHKILEETSELVEDNVLDYLAQLRDLDAVASRGKKERLADSLAELAASNSLIHVQRYAVEEYGDYYRRGDPALACAVQTITGLRAAIKNDDERPTLADTLAAQSYGRPTARHTKTINLLRDYRAETAACLGLKLDGE